MARFPSQAPSAPSSRAHLRSLRSIFSLLGLVLITACGKAAEIPPNVLTLRPDLEEVAHVEPTKLRFCCDPNVLSPQPIGTLRVTTKPGVLSANVTLAVNTDLVSGTSRNIRNPDGTTTFEIDLQAKTCFESLRGKLTITGTMRCDRPARTECAYVVETPIDICNICFRGVPLRIAGRTPAHVRADGIDPKTGGPAVLKVRIDRVDARGFEIYMGDKLLEPAGNPVVEGGQTVVPVRIPATDTGGKAEIREIRARSADGLESQPVPLILAPNDKVSAVTPPTTIHAGQSGVRQPVYVVNMTADPVTLVDASFTAPSVMASQVRTHVDPRLPDPIPAGGIDTVTFHHSSPFGGISTADPLVAGEGAVILAFAPPLSTETILAFLGYAREPRVSVRGGEAASNGFQLRNGGDGGFFGVTAGNDLEIGAASADPAVTTTGTSTVPPGWRIDQDATLTGTTTFTAADNAALVIPSRPVTLNAGSSGSTSSSTLSRAIGDGEPFGTPGGGGTGQWLVIESGTNQGRYRIFGVLGSDTLLLADTNGNAVTLVPETGVAWRIEPRRDMLHLPGSAGGFVPGTDRFLAPGADFGGASGGAGDVLVFEGASYVIRTVLSSAEVRLDTLAGTPVETDAPRTSLNWHTEGTRKIRVSGGDLVMRDGVKVTREDDDYVANVLLQSDDGDVKLDAAALDVEGHIIVRAPFGSIVVNDSALSVDAVATVRAPGPDGGAASLVAGGGITIAGTTRVGARGGRSQLNANGNGGAVVIARLPGASTPAAIRLGSDTLIDVAGGESASPTDFGPAGSAGTALVFNGDGRVPGADVVSSARILANGGRSTGERGGDGGFVLVAGYDIRLGALLGGFTADAGGGESVGPAGDGRDGGRAGGISLHAVGRMWVPDDAALRAIGGAADRRAGVGGSVSLIARDIWAQGLYDAQGGQGTSPTAVAGDGGGDRAPAVGASIAQVEGVDVLRTSLGSAVYGRMPRAGVMRLNRTDASGDTELATYVGFGADFGLGLLGLPTYGALSLRGLLGTEPVDGTAIEAHVLGGVTFAASRRLAFDGTVRSPGGTAHLQTDSVSDYAGLSHAVQGGRGGSFRVLHPEEDANDASASRLVDLVGKAELSGGNSVGLAGGSAEDIEEGLSALIASVQRASLILDLRAKGGRDLRGGRMAGNGGHVLVHFLEGAQTDVDDTRSQLRVGGSICVDAGEDATDAAAGSVGLLAGMRGVPTADDRAEVEVLLHGTVSALGAGADNHRRRGHYLGYLFIQRPDAIRLADRPRELLAHHRLGIDPMRDGTRVRDYGIYVSQSALMQVSGDGDTTDGLDGDGDLFIESLGRDAVVQIDGTLRAARGEARVEVEPDMVAPGGRLAVLGRLFKRPGSDLPTGERAVSGGVRLSNRSPDGTTRVAGSVHARNADGYGSDVVVEAENVLVFDRATAGAEPARIASGTGAGIAIVARFAQVRDATLFDVSGQEGRDAGFVEFVPIQEIDFAADTEVHAQADTGAPGRVTFLNTDLGSGTARITSGDPRNGAPPQVLPDASIIEVR